MGVTIHFEGTLRDEAAFEHVIRSARTRAEQEGWKSEVIAEDIATLWRVRNEEDCEYTGPTRGILLYPHENAEPLRLEFDRALFMQDYIKTQFAPAEIHIRVVRLLKEIAPQFVNLTVEDEGEFWGSESREVLAGHLDACFRAINDQLKSRSDVRGPVRLANGRIADLVEAPE
jgi:hypothetical protein